MKTYKTKTKRIPGTSYKEIRKGAFKIHQEIKRKSKRKPYIRSVYFKKDKIFLDLFWTHIFEKKNYWDQMRRTKFTFNNITLVCRLIDGKYPNYEAVIPKENPNKLSEILHRFAGTSADNELFFVQIKEDKRTGRKYLISIFPVEKWK